MRRPAQRMLLAGLFLTTIVAYASGAYLLVILYLAVAAVGLIVSLTRQWHAARLQRLTRGFEIVPSADHEPPL